MQVDLSLAINYLPACLCLSKLFLFLLAITVVPHSEEIGGLSIVAMALCIDRVLTKNLIFDSNAILMAVYFANVIQLVRHHQPNDRMPFVHIMVHCGWIVCCLYLIVEPIHFKRFFEKRHRLYNVIPALLMFISVGCLVFIHAEREHGSGVVARGMTFAMLCIAWVYIVGVRQCQNIDMIREQSSHFIGRFAPTLYSPPWLAVLFSIGAVCGLVYQYMQLFYPVDPSNAGLTQVEVKIETQNRDRQVKIEAKQDQQQGIDPSLEEIFKQARQAIK